AGPPNWPTSPPPANRILVPSSTPAGIFASTVRCFNTRPSPLHLAHGSVITLPVPWQVGQVRAMLKNPCWYRTWPRPEQERQVVGALPAAAPEPRHSSQAS